MRVALVCAGGMSTSMLVTNMRKFAGEDDTIEAYGWANLEEFIDRFDVILVGPQISFHYAKIKTICEKHSKKCAQINVQIFGGMNGKAAMALAEETMNGE